MYPSNVKGGAEMLYICEFTRKPHTLDVFLDNTGSNVTHTRANIVHLPPAASRREAHVAREVVLTFKSVFFLFQSDPNMVAQKVHVCVRVVVVM